MISPFREDLIFMNLLYVKFAKKKTPKNFQTYNMAILSATGFVNP